LFNPGLRDQVPMSIANLAGNWVAF
jgi:hypothetical protein